MPRTTDAQRERRELEILRVAGQMIQEHGYTNLNMDALAERVGISKPTLYQHFKTKEDMVAQTVLHANEALEKYVFTLREGTPIQRLEQIMRHVIASHFDPSDISTGLYTDQIAEILKFHMGVQGSLRRLEGMLSAIVHESMIAGEIRPEMLPHVVVGSLFAMLGVIEFNRRILPPEQHPILVEQVVQMWLRGVRA